MSGGVMGMSQWQCADVLREVPDDVDAHGILMLW